MVEESHYMHVYKIDFHIREWMKFLTSESYHPLKEVMIVLRGKMKKQVVLKQEQPHLHLFKREKLLSTHQHSKSNVVITKEKNGLF